jgi:ribosomal protein S12 methylthiotransferase accessory factor
LSINDVSDKGIKMDPKPLQLQDAFKQYRHDQDKVITPEQTVERLRRRLAQIDLDILEDIVRIDKGRLDIPVYFSICGSDARNATGNYKQMGKGATPAQSQASAVMELAERFSLFSYIHNPQNFTVAPKRSLDAPCMGFDQIARSVDDNSDDLDRLSALYSSLPLQWTWAFNLTRGEAEMVPFNWFWTINQFNGSSAGNCKEEALCQGICEVVERHVSALVSSRGIKVPQIRLESINDPVALELIGKYRAAGIELRLSDFTLDMGIPSIGALAWDPATFPDKSEIVWTAGTTPSPSKALCRALTEVAQLAGEFNSGGNYVASGLPKFRTLEDAGYIIDPGSKIALTDLPEIGDNNIKVEIERCVSALADRGMDIYAVDVAHPVLGVPAFYTIVPGTRFRERAAHSSVGMIIAKIITETHEPVQALERLQAFDAQLPNKYYLQFYLGQIHLNRGDYETALAYLDNALDLQPPAEDTASVYTYLGICYKEMARYDAARQVLERGHAIDPERTDTLNLLGFCHYKLGAHEQAIACFKKLIALDPSSAIDYANIASNYRAMGKKTEAIQYYQLALSLDAGIEFARDHLAQLGVDPDAD